VLAPMLDTCDMDERRPLSQLRWKVAITRAPGWKRVTDEPVVMMVPAPSETGTTPGLDPQTYSFWNW
jgi:hypothetical protein